MTTLTNVILEFTYLFKTRHELQWSDSILKPNTKNGKIEKRRQNHGNWEYWEQTSFDWWQQPNVLPIHLYITGYCIIKMVPVLHHSPMCAEEIRKATSELADGCYSSLSHTHTQKNDQLFYLLVSYGLHLYLCYLWGNNHMPTCAYKHVPRQAHSEEHRAKRLVRRKAKKCKDI